MHNAEDPGSCDDTNRGPSCAQAPCICDNAGDCKSGGGTACTGTADCAGGRFCVDSVCCDTTCGGVCNSCLSSQTHGSTGTCAPIAAGLDPDNECAGPTACNGASSCYTSAQGSSCSHGYECTTGVCDSERIYDKDFAEYVTVGTCCDRECPDGCTSCRGVGTGGVAAGTCATIVRNSDPDAACATVVSGHVLQLSLCDGHGACQLQNGATCTLNDQCRSDNCQYAACGGPVECQDHGTCQ